MKKFALLFLSLLIYPAGAGFAETAAQKGYRILKKSADKSSGYVDSQSKGNMVLKSAAGKTSVRKFYTKAIESNNGAGRGLLVFEWPGDIRNTGLLTHSKNAGSDNQWLFLPSIGRVKKISSQGRSGSFVGSEFAYEDMVDQNVDKYTYKWIKTGSCPGGGSCQIVDRFSKHKTGYSKQRVWVDTNEYRIRKVNYYNRGGDHQKTLLLTRFKRYNGKFWRAATMTMANHQTGKSTKLDWSNRKFGTGISKREMSVNALKRLR
jgi:hypothetical protein